MRLPAQVSSFQGCLLGLALGDALGAPLEGGVLERALWRVIGSTRDGRRRWTDDTQMALDLAESLVASHSVDQDDLARRFARGYRWSRGYGPGAARLLKLVRRGVDWRTANTRVFRDGSYGNGGAMRAPIVGLFYASQLDCVGEHARSAAVVTHAHPLGQQGAALLALATALLVRGSSASDLVATLLRQTEPGSFQERLALAATWLEQERPTANEVRLRLGNGVAAVDSCVTSIYVALRFLDEPFTSLLDFVAAVGGDVDTIGAMAGALWGARHGDAGLSSALIQQLEDAERVREVARRLHHAASGRLGAS